MKKILFLCFALALTACAPMSETAIYKKQNRIENLLPSDFVLQKFATDTFILYGLLRPSKNKDNKDLHVYIEGDGLAWITRTKISNNPTPTDNVTAMLAQKDNNSAAILYLARPCQYVENADRKFCDQKYWTSHRLANEVISSLNSAVSQAKNKVNAEKVSLVGFSGGGGAAVLVASRRNDVDFLGSVAGLLDHKTWTEYHKISPLKGSLNPIDKIQNVKNIKQLHLHGSKDDILPFSTQENYCLKLNQKEACKEIQGMQHNAAWYNYWNYNY